MTEAESPREIAEKLARDMGEHFTGEKDDTCNSCIALAEQALLSYAAERERLLAEMTTALERLASMEAFCGPRALRGAADEELLARIEYAGRAVTRLSSRPATEGKREDE